MSLLIVLTALARMLFMTGLLGLFGTLLFRVTVAPVCWREFSPERENLLRQDLAGLARGCLGVTIVAGLVFVFLDRAIPAFGTAFGRAGPAGWIAACLVTLTRTGSGLILVAQAAFAGLAVQLLGDGTKRARRLAAVALSAAALGLQANRDAVLPGPLVVLDLTRLWATGAWLGMLPALVLVFRASPTALVPAARRAGTIGRWALLLLAATTLAEAPIAAGGIAGLLGTGLGHLLLLQGSAFAVLAALALVFWGRLAPDLDGDRPARAVRRVRAAFAVQGLVALLLLFTAAAAALVSRATLSEPLWPFGVMPDIAAALRQPARRGALVLAMGLAGVALLAVSAAIRWRRGRAVAIGVAVAAFLAATPGLSGIFMAAHPTSYFRSPTGYSARSVADGLQLHRALCAGCHGATGGGDGPEAVRLPRPPRDYRLMGILDRTDGELFWIVAHGIDPPTAMPGIAMPGFGRQLDHRQIWTVIDAVRFLAGAGPVAASD